MAQAVSPWPVTAESRVRSQAGSCELCGGESSIGTGFSASTSVFSCQLHSTNAPYTFIHLPHTLYNVSLPVLQFSPVTIIPPMLHTHSFTYHPRCIMFFFQYFSFPVSIIPPLLHTHLQLHAALITANGRSLGTFQKRCSFVNR